MTSPHGGEHSFYGSNKKKKDGTRRDAKLRRGDDELTHRQILPLTVRFCFVNRFNSIFRNVNVTLLCITNMPTMLYAACPEKFIRGGGAPSI